MTAHPSFLTLDRHALGESTPAVSSHVAGCLTCRAHVDAVMVAAPIPARVLEVRPAPAPRWLELRWLQVLVPLVATAGLAVVLINRPPPDDVRAKGSPTAVAWVKRGDEVSAWTGAPLVPGDAVRFQVVLEHFTRVTVIDATSKSVLYEAVVTKETTTPAWTLDAAPGGDVVWVVLSNEAVTPAIVDSCDGMAVWCRRFELRAGSR
jgi:hypothetical protein